MVTRTGSGNRGAARSSPRRKQPTGLFHEIIRFPYCLDNEKTLLQQQKGISHGEAESATSELFAWMASVTSFRENVSVPSLKL